MQTRGKLRKRGVPAASPWVRPMKAPPLLPEETFHRVVRVANVDGLCVLAISGLLALASASVVNYQGAAFGLLVAAAGAIELHGVGLLRAGEPRGMNWLVASQPYLAAVVLVYCALQWGHPDMALWRAVLSDKNREVIAAAGLSEDEFLRRVHTFGITLLGMLTMLYQGGMTLYYLRRRTAVMQAVETDLTADHADV